MTCVFVIIIIITVLVREGNPNFIQYLDAQVNGEMDKKEADEDSDDDDDDDDDDDEDDKKEEKEKKEQAPKDEKKKPEPKPEDPDEDKRRPLYHAVSERLLKAVQLVLCLRAKV